MPPETPQGHQPQAMPQQSASQNVSNQNPQVADNSFVYDSNPFTLSFKGFGLFAQYAKGVVIAIVIFGLLSFVGNIISEISSNFSDRSNNQSSTSFFDDVNDDRQVTIQDDFSGSSESLITNGSNQNDTVDGGEIAGIVVIIGIVILGIIIVAIPFSAAISAVFKGVIAAGMVASMHKRTITFGEAFSAMGNRFTTLFLSELIVTLKIIGGYMLFIVPGIRAQLRYKALPYIIMNEESVSASQAITKSKELYRGHLIEILGIGFVGGIIPFIGQAIDAGGVGLSYQQIAYYKENNLQTPKTHWLNYIGLILAILFILFIAGIILLLAAI